MRLVFDWDPRKAESNRVKHGIVFDEAMTIFSDPLALTIFDDEHSEDEDRWITLGISKTARLLLVVHAHIAVDQDEMMIRIISARRPTRKEAAHYERGIER